MSQLNAGCVPDYHRAHRGRWLRWLGRRIFKAMGWRLEGKFPRDRHMIIALAPHTSNWDFMVAVQVLLGLDLNCRWLGKNTLFTPPLGYLMRKLGGIPVDRKNPGTLVDDVAAEIRGLPAAALVIAPEGTRGRVENWKTGFLRIARAADCRILPVALDYREKRIVLGDLLEVEAEPEQQIRRIKEYFQQFTPKRPENF